MASENMASGRPLALSSGVKEIMDEDDRKQTFTEFKLVKRDSIHVALSAPTRYDSQEAAHRIRWSSQVEAILFSIHGTNAPPSVQNPSWDEVLEDIDSVRQRHRQSRLSQDRGLAQLLYSMTDIVPDEKGLAALKWGLSTVFKLWIHRIENVERVMISLRDVPSQFAKTSRALKHYSHDQQLKYLTDDYYVATMDALRQLLTIVHQKSTANSEERKGFQDTMRAVGTKMKAAAKSTGHLLLNRDKEVIDDVLDRLQTSRDNLNSWVENLDRARDCDTNAVTHQTNREAKAIRATASEINHQCKELNSGLSTVADRLGNLERAIYGSDEQGLEQKRRSESIQQATTPVFLYNKGSIETAGRLESAFGRRRRGSVAIVVMPRCLIETMQTGLHEIAAENEYKRRESRSNTFEQPTRLHYRPMSLDPDKICLILGIKHDMSLIDEDYVLGTSHQMSQETLLHVGSLMSNPEFKYWLGAPRSTALVVDVHCGDGAIGWVSPMSVFCASLATSLALNASFIVLDHFCGQHANAWGRNGLDNAAGPKGLIINLIGQLMMYPDRRAPDLNFVEPDLYQHLCMHDISALCFVFEALLHQVSSDTVVFCIIDGISDFETRRNDWSSQLYAILDSLVSLTERGNRLPSFKLLLGSGDHSKYGQRRRELPSIDMISRELHGGDSILNRRVFGQDVNRCASTRVSSQGSGRNLLMPPQSHNTSHTLGGRNNRSQQDLREQLMPESRVREVVRVRSTSSFR